MEQISVLYDAHNAIKAEEFLLRNPSVAIESVSISENDTPEDLKQYIADTESTYIYIYDSDYIYGANFLQALSESLLNYPDTDIAMTAHRFADDTYHLIAPPYRAFGQSLYDHIYPGHTLWDTYEREHVNMIGGVGCCLFRKNRFEQLSGEEILDLITTNSSEKRKTILKKLFQRCLIRYVDVILAARIAKPAAEQTLTKKYESWHFTAAKQPLTKGVLKKELTFFHTDMGEYYNILPVAQEAIQRGYGVTYTQNREQKAEIGIYCQHVCYPENSKFSVILLHDLEQDSLHWPNLWELEPWNQFDIGILPGASWSERWRTCGALYYANPRCGVYPLGYPKSDIHVLQEYQTAARDLRKRLNLKYPYTILYAPSWENDGKEEDFVSALATLPVNLLIKQAHWNPVYDFVIRNIAEMRALHEGRYENLYYIEPSENIMSVLALCDLMVSDESNVLVEALMFHKPGIAVTDWTIPDCNPPRMVSFPSDYALHCKKAELRSCVERFLAGDMDFNIQMNAAKSLFGNQENVCKDIMDAIDYYTGYGTRNSFLSKRLIPRYLPFD